MNWIVWGEEGSIGIGLLVGAPSMHRIASLNMGRHRQVGYIGGANPELWGHGVCCCGYLH